MNNLKDVLARKAITQLWGWRGKVLLAMYDAVLAPAIKAYQDRDAATVTVLLVGAKPAFENAMAQFAPKG